MQCVLRGLDGEIAVGDRDALVGFDRVGGRGDVDSAAGDLDIVLAGDTVVGAVDGQGAQTVEYEIILGEDDGVGVGVAVSGEGAGDGQLGGRALYGGDEYLVGVLDVDRGRGAVLDGRAVEHKLNLIVIAGVYDDGRISCGAGDHINALFGDGDIIVIAEIIIDRVGEIRCLLEVTIGEYL